MGNHKMTGFEELYRYVMERSRRLGIPHIPLEDAYVLQGTSFAALANAEGVALDLGAGIGFSALWILQAAKAFGKRLIAVEREARFFEELKGLAEKAGFEAVHGDALDFLKGFEEPVAFAFVDVDKEQYPDVLELLYEKLGKGGVMLFHNAIFPPPPQTFFEKLKELKVKYLVVPTSLGLVVAAKT
ncbi:O-methyltransferase [Ignicoccus hospitalis]|uniref:O-methyltransferase, family 3 n=1 Tax=Ignicoccus hospitalis (strain KIN4/I / DSM 18386 / JCM 14125) TaxID=453591 RepID=A8AB15_IGNH4|nr:class I SAM-dependent methyltransferase [Ignicoccus hospitalis]ABU82117.1 O-methyltransferase, family 3 [Ignicoccus hospitalis KIN4/I]HIH91075.1 hypothetical protein [Desulfurococcaceae archaeon]